MRIKIGMYMNAKRGYSGAGALNSYAVRNIEQLLVVKRQLSERLIDVEIALSRDRLEHWRATEDGMDSDREVHWKGARQFDLKRVEALGPSVGKKLTGSDARLLTGAAFKTFVGELVKDKGVEPVLVLWGHADGPRAFLFSSYRSQPGRWSRDLLSPYEVEAALEALKPDPLRLVCIDACQGACLEFASVLSPYAKYLIASQTPVPGRGWNYATWPLLLPHNGADWRAAAKAIATDFASQGYSRASVSVIDLAEIERVLQALERFTSLVIADSSALLGLIAAGTTLKSHDNNQRGMVDILTLFDALLTKYDKSPRLQAACNEVIEAVRSSIVYNYCSDDLANTPLGGCSIFLPNPRADFGDAWNEITTSVYLEEVRQLKRFKESGWHELVRLVWQ